jgi:hypothetical protein
MMRDEVQWTWSDGWLLMALFLATPEKGALLHELIGAADATNHAIPTVQELSLALTKFVQCGLVTVTGDRYAISPEHNAAVRKAYKGKGGLFASGDKGLRFLTGSGLVPANNHRVELTEREVGVAYKRYLKATWGR